MNPALLAMLLLAMGCLASAYKECQFHTPLVAGGQDCGCVVPWMVSLRKRRDNSHFCGGTLIAPTIVLTAAHCLLGGAPSTVHIGRVDREGDDGSGFESGNVVRAILHEDYNVHYIDNNDVALLLLDKPSEKKPAVLAEHDLCFDTSRGCEVRLYGWGRLCDNCPLAETIQCAVARSIPRQKCSDLYGAIPKTPLELDGRPINLGITDTMICAGKKDVDTCDNDSGGPIVVRGAVVGIVSWGLGCADERFPGVYASVPKLRCWIDEKLAELDIRLDTP